MSIAYPITEGENAIDVYDRDFDDLIDYQIRLTDKSFCSPPVIINVDGVFQCDDKVKLSFVLPCLDVGEYIMDIIDDSNPDEPIYKFNSIYY